MRRSILMICISAALILVSQNAMAGTRISISIGLPVVPVFVNEVVDEGPYDDSVWVEGHYYYEHPRYVWVPGHWEPVHHERPVHVQRPPVNRQYPDQRLQTPWGSYNQGGNRPQAPWGSYNQGGNRPQAPWGSYNQESYHNNQRNGQNSQNNGKWHNNNSGQSNNNHQQNQSQGQYSNQRNNGYQSGGNRMNNINIRVIKRQVTQIQ